MRYLIKFANGFSILVRKSNVTAPSLRKAIEYIESEPGCSGLTLDNGIAINKVKWAPNSEEAA